MNEAITRRGLALLGCGKMGSAMLAGWLERGLPASSVWVVDPNPSDWLRGLDGLNLNDGLPDDPALLLVAVKPQVMADALGQLSGLAADTVVVSVAAGVPVARYAALLGDAAPIIRAMPNTPAAVGRGITALIGNAHVDEPGMRMAEDLLSAVGQTVRLDREAQMDAVTAVSGSGPAYVFHMIEALAEAGEAEGLAPALALQLAQATVAGAGALAEGTGTAPGTLRENVTSPGGTTAAGLSVLMRDAGGLRALLRETVGAAAARSRALGQ